MDRLLRVAKGRAALAGSVFTLLVIVYQANGDFLPGNDAKPNVYLAVSILKEGNLSFTPREAPFMFNWTLESDRGPVPVRLRSWNQTLNGRSVAELHERGVLRLRAEKYYVVPSVRPGVYVSMYGPGPALVALPVLALLDATAGDLSNRPAMLWYGSKVVASLCVAAAAVFLLLSALPYTTRGRAVLVALAFGLGTGVWSTSSQALWQHGPHTLFIACGCYLLTRIDRGWPYAALCALSYGAAVACRPTSAIVAVAVGIHLIATHRRLLWAYALAAAPVAAALALYNSYYLGAPWRFGQTVRAVSEAVAVNGAPGVWQTPLWEGLAGHLVSPSRGLLVYSPFLAFAIVGMVRAWRRGPFAFLRPLSVALVVQLLVASKWYYWWGGWSFGYRLLLDSIVLLALLLVPAVEWMRGRRIWTAVFVLLLAWSVVVQATGAWAYNLRGWNARIAAYRVELPGRAEARKITERAEAERLAAAEGGRIVGVERHNVDLPRYRHRLWSVGDSQIRYYLLEFAAARRMKREMMRKWLDDPTI